MASEDADIDNIVDRARDNIDALIGSANTLSNALTRAFTQAAIGGRTLDDVLKSLALRMSNLAVGQAFGPISDSVVNVLGGVLPSSLAASAFGSDSSSNAAFSNVTVNVATPDVSSFQRSESYLSGQIARAVARGQRTM